LREVVDTQLPVTMVGSYPRPLWYKHQLHGQDIQHAFKLEEHAQAYEDATAACIRDQEEAGLDIVADGQMYFDDYGGSIGSFVWYWYERLGGFTKAKLPNPLATAIEASPDGDLSQAAWMHNWGGTAVTAEVSRGIPGRLSEMYTAARQLTDKPLKVSVGAGPPNLTYHVDFNHPESAYSDARRLAEDLVPIFNSDLKDLVAHGADYIQIEDLGAWMLALEGDNDWVLDVLNAWVDGVDAKLAWHCCLGAGYGNTFRAVEDALPRVLERWMAVNVDEYALDFALRDMADVKALRNVPAPKRVQAGVIDIRTLYIESDDEIVARIHKVLEHIEPERVTLSTDCGLKALPRFCAYEKLRALSRAAARVREEVRTPAAA
jgi:methionine synthase II (cobalamin-independent)